LVARRGKDSPGKPAGGPRPLGWPADDRGPGRLAPPPGRGQVLYPGAGKEAGRRLSVVRDKKDSR
jgi:hypothetical protein